MLGAHLLLRLLDGLQLVLELVHLLLQCGILSLGQSAAFANEVKPVAEIFAQILDEAGVALDRVNRCAVSGNAV